MVARGGCRALLLAASLGATACHFTLADNPAQYSCGGDFICPPGTTCGSDQFCQPDDAGPNSGDGGCALACAQGERCVQGACACDPATCTGSLSCNGANRCIQGSCTSGGTDCQNASECCSAVCSQQCGGCGHVGASCGNGGGGGGGGCCVGLGCNATGQCAACQGEGAPCNVATDCCLNVCTGGLCASRQLCDSNCNGCNSGNCVCPLGDRCSNTSSCRNLGWHGSCQ